MKKHIIVVLISLICFSNFGTSQTLTDTDKKKILRDLQFQGFLASTLSSEDGRRVLHAVYQVKYYKITEAIPIIESDIWSCNDYIIDAMLRALYELKAPNLHSVVKAVADTAVKVLAGSPRKHEQYFNRPAYILNKSNYYLFKLGDYTYAGKFVEYVQGKGGFGFDEVFMGGDLGQAVPAYRDFVKTELLKVMYADTTENGSKRYDAFRELKPIAQYYLSDLTAYFTNTTNEGRINPLIAEKVSSYKYSPFEEALKTKLTSNIETWYHRFYIRELLKNYGTLDNYLFVIKYAEAQQNESIKNIADDEVSTFVFGPPFADVSVSNLLDSLLTAMNRFYALNWFGDKNFEKELTNHFDNAKKHLLNGDSLNSSKEVAVFQGKVNMEYEKTIDNEKKIKPRDKRFVTVEGWKFLYYNAQYIIDRLPGKEKKQ